MSSIKRIASDGTRIQEASLVNATSSPTFSDAIERLAAVHARLEDQVKSLGHLGNCYLGTLPESGEEQKASLGMMSDGAVHILADHVGAIEELVSALEGKIDRFRGRH